MNTVQAIRTRLSDSTVSYKEGSALRVQLAQIAEESYIPQHTPQEHLAFLSRNEGGFKKIGGQDINFPYVWKFFSVVSQHVCGDCIEECLDKAMELETASKAQMSTCNPEDAAAATSPVWKQALFGVNA